MKGRGSKALPVGPGTQNLGRGRGRGSPLGVDTRVVQWYVCLSVGVPRRFRGGGFPNLPMLHPYHPLTSAYPALNAAALGHQRAHIPFADLPSAHGLQGPGLTAR